MFPDFRGHRCRHYKIEIGIQIFNHDANLSYVLRVGDPHGLRNNDWCDCMCF
jgi:hypothetical protein